MLKLIISFLVSIGAVSNPGNTVYLPTIIPTQTSAPIQMIATQPAPTQAPTETPAPAALYQEPTATPVYQPEQVSQVDQTEYQLIYVTSTFQPMEEATQAGTTPEWMQWIGTPDPNFLTPAIQPFMVIDADKISNIDIDDVWDVIATPGRLQPNTFPECPNPLPQPFVDQSMSVEASLLDGENSESIELQASDISRIMQRGGGHFPPTGKVARPENGLLFELGMYIAGGDMKVCQDSGGVTMYGNGVQRFLDNLKINYWTEY